MTLSADLERYRADPTVGIERIAIGPRAAESLAAIIQGLPAHATIAVLTDGVAYSTASGLDVKPAVIDELRGLGTLVFVTLDGDVHDGAVHNSDVLGGDVLDDAVHESDVLEGAVHDGADHNSDVHADERTVAAAVERCRDADVLVTIGSGTLCDIGKVAAGDRPHVVVQTAASVNGFADDQSVLLINGVKRTTHTGWPSALVVDSDILGGAPPLLNRSGLGDMISMFTAPADWYLSSLVGMDRGWSSEAALMTRRYGDELLGIASGIGSSDPRSLATLAEFLTLSGISMGIAGQTSPSSGMEHTVSHMLDMSNGARRRGNAHHGAQVGVATVVVAILWRRMRQQLADGALVVTLPVAADAQRFVRSAFAWMDEDGATGEECWKDYSRKLDHWRSHDAAASIRTAQSDWAPHATVLSGLLDTPERVVTALRSAGAPTRFSELENPSSPDDVSWALQNCHLMRNRFTIADLAFLTGNWTADHVASVLAEAAELGAGL